MSPVPIHLRTEREVRGIPIRYRDHQNDLVIDPAKGSHVRSCIHPAKYARGLPTALLSLAGTKSIGDPMAGSGRFFEETRVVGGAANDLDPFILSWMQGHSPKVTLTNVSATDVVWRRECLIFSPPYYPRTDRRVPNAHDDKKRGPVVGFRDAYRYDHYDFIGNPAGCNGILTYRNSMRKIYTHLRTLSKIMILVTKNWTRLGVELRLDLDTILTAGEAGWRIKTRHGFKPVPSLWSRFNRGRGSGVDIEDILIFE